MFEDNTGIEVALMKAPYGTDSRLVITVTKEGMPSWGVVTNPDVEHPEVLAAIIDYTFSEEYTLLRMMGIEGESYTVDADGNAMYTDTMSTPYNGYSGSMTKDDLGWLNHPILRAFGCSDYYMEVQGTYDSETYAEAMAIRDAMAAGEVTPIYSQPTPTLEQADADEYNAIMGPINTLVSEFSAKAIRGEYDIDAEWDNFIDTIYEYGDIDRAVEILNSYETVEVIGDFK